jgi:hypothetical protein
VTAASQDLSRDRWLWARDGASRRAQQRYERPVAASVEAKTLTESFPWHRTDARRLRVLCRAAAQRDVVSRSGTT